MKKTLTSLTVAAIGVVLVLLISEYTILFSGLEQRYKDGLFFIREPAPKAEDPYLSDRVQLVGIDEASLSIGKWPFYRDIHARYLQRLQQFAPHSTFLDITFVEPEKVPQSLVAQFGGETPQLQQVRSAYTGIDLALANEFAKHTNVFFDLFLADSARKTPYEDRIMLTEERMKAFSQDAGIGAVPRYFSLEPLLEAYQNSAIPATVNVHPDQDHVQRNYTLVHTYSNHDGSVRNYFSIVLQLLKLYYHVNNDDINISPEKVVLRFAAVPKLNASTRQPEEKEVAVEQIAPQLKAYARPAHFNENLYRSIQQDFRLNFPDDPEKIPAYPVRLVKRADGWELLEGFEAWEAAKAMGSKKVRAILCEEKTVEIAFGKTMPNSYPINFGARQEQYYRDPVTKQRATFSAIPRSSYVDVYNTPVLPALPAPGERLSANAANELLNWYRTSKLPERFNVLIAKVKAKYGSATGETVVKYATEDNPDLGKHFFFRKYLNAANPTDLASAQAGYKAFAAAQGLTPSEDQLLTEDALVKMLVDEWSSQFQRYQGKFVFTGAYTTGMATDVHQTPFGTMFGINAIIWAFSTVVTENQLHEVPSLWFYLAFVLLILGLGVAYGFLDIRLGGLVFILSFIATFVVSYLLFHLDNLFVKTIPFAIGNLSVFVALVIIKVLTEEKDKRFLKATFSSYLAPELIDEMYESKQMPKLGGDSGIRTAFFTDIQGFSTFSEKLTASQLVELLNEYLGSMTDILLAEKGTLDKYIGDAIIGIFGAPMNLPDHALRACKVAIGMQANLARLRDKWSKEMADPAEPNRNVKNLSEAEWAPGAKWPRIVWDMRVRVGVNSGDMVTGNMGSTMRMNYTMMGDPVNLAARLEAGAKQFGVYTLVSGDTLNCEWTDEAGKNHVVKDEVEARFIDRITVVGKSEPVEVFEVIALKGQLTDEQQKLFALFADGVKKYQAMEWDAALEIFRQTKEIELFPKNKFTPSLMYIERCETFKHNPPVPPGEAWDGVFRMTQKH